MSEKIRIQHLERKAILYVRQSSPYQVIHNLESQKLQYTMEARLHQLGWHEIEVVDEDLGRSAEGTVTRAGFERMVAEVCLGKVGVVAAREVSRFARNSREWQQLIEVCRVVDTVLIDQEMVYTPRQSNDRLLLGLKGSLNEYELDLLRQRSPEARRAKAQRGELVVAATVGYIKTEEQHLEKDPDRRVQREPSLGWWPRQPQPWLDGWKDSERSDVAGTQKFSGLKSPVFPASDLKDKEEKPEQAAVGKKP